jgi:CRP/FNR family transcriptional regulator
VTTADPALLARVKAAMPSLAQLPPDLEAELARALTVVRLPAGTPVFRPTDACPGFPIVLDGRVQATRTLDNGRELLIYDVESGESCEVSTACMLGNNLSDAHGNHIISVYPLLGMNTCTSKCC